MIKIQEKGWENFEYFTAFVNSLLIIFHPGQNNQKTDRNIIKQIPCITWEHEFPFNFISIGSEGKTQISTLFCSID